MRRFWACYCTLALLAVGTAAGQEVLVGFDRAVAARTAALGDTPAPSALRTLGLREAGPGRRLARRGPLADVLAVAVADSAALRRALAAWATVPGVRFVQPNHRYTLDTIVPAGGEASRSAEVPGRVGRAQRADVPWDSLPHLVAVGAREAQRVTTGNRRVRVAFLDSGLWFEHPALAHAAWTNPREIPSNGLDDDGNGFVDDVRGWDFVDRVGSTGFGDVRGRDNDPSDDNTPGSTGRGHGTSVAGVVAARYLMPTAASGPGFAYGIAPDVSIVPLRVCAADGGCDDDDIAAALVYAADMGFEVANLSFGSDYVSQVLRDAVAYAVSKNVLLVASAGNQPIARAHYPSDYPGVVSSVWLSEDGTARASGAQFGPGVTLGAPATATRTTTMPLPEQMSRPGALYDRPSGSSFAAPLVSGAAALLLSQDSTLTAASVRSILTATADDLGRAGWDEQTGAGKLRVDRALLRSLPARLTIESPEQDGGTSAARLPIVGTVLDPSFVSYDVFYAAGDSVIAQWNPIASNRTTPVLRGELAVWNTAGLADGVYTLRLSLLLREGQRIEERRRVWLDRTAPRVTVVRALAGYQDDRYAALYEVTTDDLTRLDASCTPTPSDRIARRHGLVAVLPTPLAGAPVDARCALTATNRAGLQTRVDAPAVTWPAAALDPNLLRETPLTAPSGILLPRLTDFDRDGRAEVTLNRANGEATTDTTLIYEWTGAGASAGLALVQRLVVEKSSARPRDAGDTDGNGRAELLLQSGGSSGVAEAAAVGGFPSALAFVSPDTLFAARFTDLDRDGRGEILGHNGRAWRVYEWNGTAFVRVASLPNPTPLGTGEVRENLYSEPEAAVGDFDGDGQTEFAVADLDGDLAVFEARGDNTYVPTWQEASDRYASRPKMAVGDFDGDGRPEFVVQRENFEATRSTDRQQEPPIATFTAFTATGNDAFRALGSVSFPLPPTRYSATATLDLDGDGRDELAVAVGARLYVFSWTDGGFPGGGFQLRFVRSISGRGEGADGLRSVTLATGDLDGDGRPDLVAAMGTGRLSLFTSAAPASALSAPEIVHAAPSGAAAVLLGWRSAPADSTVLFRRRSAADPLERVAAVPRCCALASVAAPPGAQTYFVRAWRAGVASPLSEGRTVAPGRPRHGSSPALSVPTRTSSAST